MRRLLLLPVLCLAACGDNLHPTPVDMVYDVRVTVLADDCDAAPPMTDDHDFLDLRLLSDGRVQMDGYPFAWPYGIPLENGLPTMAVYDGRVDEEIDVHADYPDEDEPYRISGTLDMDALDLTIDADWYRVESNGPVGCHRKSHVAGAARAFLDPASPDGIFPLKVDYLGAYCDGQTVPTVSQGTGLYRIDAFPRDGTLSMDMEHVFWLAGPTPGADGAVDWSGTYQLDGPLGLEAVPGTFKGTFKPDQVEAALEFTDSQLAPGCRYRYTLSGKKRVPSLGDHAEAYRAVFRSYDRCGMTPTSAAYDMPIEIADWDDADVVVYDPNGSWLIPHDGGALSASAGSTDQGEVVTFIGTMSPPYLSYTFDDSVEDQDGSWCSFGWDVDGVERFFPDQPWTPAFSPDATNPASVTRLAAPRPSPFAPRSFGPLSRLTSR